MENSAPEVSLTDKDLNYLDEYFDAIGAVGADVDLQEIPESPSDQEPEDYVRQLTPDQQPVPEQQILKNVIKDADDGKRSNTRG